MGNAQQPDKDREMLLCEFKGRNRELKEICKLSQLHMNLKGLSIVITLKIVQAVHQYYHFLQQLF